MAWKDFSSTLKGFILGVIIALLPLAYLLLTLYGNNFSFARDEVGMLRFGIFVLSIVIILIILIFTFIGLIVGKIKKNKGAKK